MRILIVFALVVAATVASAAGADVKIANAGTKQDIGQISGKEYASSDFCKYPDMSGITWIDGNRFYAVRNTSKSCYLYTLTPVLNASGEMTTLPGVEQGVLLQGAGDAEGIARDPCTGNVWVSDESGSTILEYDPKTGYPTYRAAPVPDVIRKNVNGTNLSLESLTISGDGLTMWTANEEALTSDGGRASQSAGTVVRLVKFTRTSVHYGWELAGMWAYLTDPIGSGTPQQSGVADLVALPDDSLLVLEREVSTGTTGRARIYRLTAEAFRSATDIRNFDKLSGASYTRVDKGSPLYSQNDGIELPGRSFDYDIACYEGLCLGPRNTDGSVNLMMVSDGGAYKTETFIFTAEVWTRAYVRALKMTGLDVRTVSFNAPADGSATVVGSNYRFLAGETVNVALCGPGYDAVAYTNRGDKAVASSSWSLPNHTPSSGTGTSMSFTVAADDTLTWNASLTPASSELLVNDTFEEYAPDTTTEGGAVTGWAGEGMVVAKKYAPPSVGYPLGRASHEKVLSIEDGEVERTYEVAAANGTKLEMMVSVVRASKPPMTDETRDQTAVYADADGHLRAFHRQNDGTCGWTVLSDDVFSNGDWIRLGVEIDYAAAKDGHAYLRAWINGTLCKPSVGLSTPGGTVGGAWLRAACDKSSSGQGKISSVAITGECGIDDVVLATSKWPSEGIDDVAVGGIPVSWFDEHGLERDPAAVVPAAKFPRLSKLGYKIGDIYTAGIRPEDDEPLTITAISTEGGKLSLEFNAIKVAPDTVYHVMGGSALGQGTKGFSELMTGASQFDEDTQEWRTTWTGDLPAEQKGTGFYFIRATRP